MAFFVFKYGLEYGFYVAQLLYAGFQDPRLFGCNLENGRAFGFCAFFKLLPEAVSLGLELKEFVLWLPVFFPAYAIALVSVFPVHI